jgi:tight adherence protein C
MNRTLLALLDSLGAAAARALGRNAGRYLESVGKQLVAAGDPGNVTAIELLGLQVIAGLLSPLIIAPIIWQLNLLPSLFEGPKQFLAYLAFVAFGFYFPLMNVRERAAERRKQIALQLPDTLDLLTISVEAGLDFMTAMRRVVEKHRLGPLRDELERFFKQTELGRPRREALRELADRVQLQDLASVVSSLIQADRLGASIGPILRTQSDMLRIRRGQRAEKAGQEAPVKILAPLVICILPAVFIMILGPVFIQMYLDMKQ